MYLRIKEPVNRNAETLDEESLSFGLHRAGDVLLRNSPLFFTRLSVLSVCRSFASGRLVRAERISSRSRSGVCSLAELELAEHLLCSDGRVSLEHLVDQLLPRRRTADVLHHEGRPVEQAHRLQLRRVGSGEMRRLLCWQLCHTATFTSTAHRLKTLREVPPQSVVERVSAVRLGGEQLVDSVRSRDEEPQQVVAGVLRVCCSTGLLEGARRGRLTSSRRGALVLRSLTGALCTERALWQRQSRGGWRCTVDGQLLPTGRVGCQGIRDRSRWRNRIPVACNKNN